MISSVSYSVSVDLEELEFSMSSDFVYKICKALHIDSLTQAHIQVDSTLSRITFFTIGGD